MAQSKIQVSQGTGTNLATHEITESAEQRHLSRTVLNDANGNDIIPFQDGDSVTITGTPTVNITNSSIPVTGTFFQATQPVSATSLPLPTGASSEATLSSLNSSTGAIDALPYNGTGNSTIISALKGLYAMLAGTLNVNQITMESQFYLAAQAVIPTTLTTGLNYFWLRNTDATKKIYICKVETIQFFSGTAAASRSNYVVRKFTGATATTGTTVNVMLAQTGNPASIADCKWSATGGTLTGATLGNNFMAIGHANQLTAEIVHDRDFTGSPIVLNQNEGIVLQSDGAVVLGTTVMFNISWIEK